MSRLTSIPEPGDDGRSLQRTTKALKQNVEVITGQRGNKLYGLPVNTSILAIITKLNEVIQRLQGGESGSAGGSVPFALLPEGIAQLPGMQDIPAGYDTPGIKAAGGIVAVDDATAITAPPGSPPPGGENYLAVFDKATKKMAAWDAAAGHYTFAVSAADIAGRIAEANAPQTMLDAIVDLDAGILAEETARIGADATLQIRATALETSVNHATTGLPATYAKVAAEETARANADSALATRATSLEATVNHSTTGVAASYARITAEETARTNADSALASRATALEASATGGGNLIPDAGFEAGIGPAVLGGKSVPADPTLNFGVNYVGDPYHPPGMNSIGGNRPGTCTGTQDLIISAYIPVEPSARYCVSGWLANHRGQADIAMFFADSSQVYISEVHSPVVTEATNGGSNLAGFQRTSVFVVSPANARYVRVFFRMYPVVGLVDHYAWLVRPMLERASAAQTQPSPWSAGAVGAYARISSAETAIATETSARATAVSQVAARLNDGGDIKTAIVQTQTTANATAAGLASTYSLTLSAGGAISGIKAFNDGSTSALRITGDQVSITPGNLVIDDGFYSPQWWSGGWVAGGNATWPTNFTPQDGDGLSQPKRFLWISPGAFAAIAGKTVAAEPGAAYRVRLRIYRSEDFTGNIFAGMHIPGVVWAMPGPVVSNAWDGGMAHLSNLEGLGSWQTYAGIYTTSSAHSYLQTRIDAEVLTGFVGIYLECVRATGASLIVDGEVTATKLAVASVSTAALQAGAATFDKISVASLGAISANLGSIITASIDLAGGSGWQYIRTASKWWGDGVNGWISAARPENGSYFQEFRASSGNSLILEQKSGGPDFGGTYYNLQLVDPNGLTRLHINPAASICTIRGRIEADEGYFSGTLNAPSGTFGTITAGYMQNSGNTCSLNLNASGTTPLLRAGSRDLILASGKTQFQNEIWSQWVILNKSILTLDPGGGGFYTYEGAVSHEFDLGANFDVGALGSQTFTTRVWGYTATWNQYTTKRIGVSGTVRYMMPPASGGSWSTCRLVVSVSIALFNSDGSAVAVGVVMGYDNFVVDQLGIAVAGLS